MSEPKYINADDAVDYLKGWVYPSKRDKKFVEAIMKFIEWYPAAPVALTSRWVWTDDGNRCKRCLKLGDPIPTPYCPHCGAKMESGDEP